MKKSVLCLLLVLALCLALVLTACKNKPEDDPNKDPGTTDSTLPGEKKGNVYTTPNTGGEATSNQPNEQVPGYTTRNEQQD